jgi:Tol biopolymer transport system component
MAAARSALMLAALILASCDLTSAPATGSAAPAPQVPGSTASAPAARTAEPSPLASARPGIKTTAVGAVPSLFRYVALDTPLVDGAHTRLWLIDLSSKRAPVLAAEWDAPASPVGGWSASADGRTVIVSASGTRSRVALSALRPETGETRVLFEDPAVTVVSARLSLDGSRYAFTKYPSQGGMDGGIWAGRIAGGDIARITEPTSATTTPQMPLAWSRDGAWLAFTRDLDRTEVHVVPSEGGREQVAGPGERVSWRATAPELVIAYPVGPGSVIYTSDLATGTYKDVVKEDTGYVTALAWDPSGQSFAFVLTESASRQASQGSWLWRADAPLPRSLNIGRTVFALEWSADGTILSAIAGGDDARIPIVDLLTGHQLSVLCRRGGTPPADCL